MRKQTLIRRFRYGLRRQVPLFVAIWTLAVATSAGQLQANEAVFTNKARFRIPYQLDVAEINRLKAEEIQLHVTTDGGKRWRHVDSVPPVDGKFTFEAAQDGEYWFSVKTVSTDGREHPAGPLKAGLKVLVDTSAPTMQLQLTESGADQVSLRWSAADEYLNVESLVLESRESAEGPWEKIQIVAVESGETSWTVPAGRTISVRGRIQDKAGNEATQQASVTVAGARAPSPQPAARRPIAETPTPADRNAASASLGQPAPRGAVSGGLPEISPGSSDYSQFVSQQGNQSAPVQQPTWGAPSPEFAATTPPVNIRRVNSTTFHIGYALDDVGPSGVSSVDLFLTEDQGRSWFHYGADEDGTSPFKVTMTNDGSYGFAIRVRSGVGLSQSPPQPGDGPEITIVVDRQPPKVVLLPLKQGHGQLPNQVLIEWTAADEQLADRPVALYYAARLSGPWQPITGWEPNSGEYLWTIGPQTPKQVYVRLEARDAAGNVARADSPDPLLVDLSRPTARIIDVESIAPRN